MNPIGIWAIKFLGGIFPFITKGFGEWIGKLLWIAAWIILALTIYHKIFEPKTVTRIDRIETQVINQCPEENKVIGFKFNLWKLKIGAGI